MVRKDSRETLSYAYYALYVTVRPRLKTTGQVSQHQTTRIPKLRVNSISTKICFDLLFLGRQTSVARLLIVDSSGSIVCRFIDYARSEARGTPAPNYAASPVGSGLGRRRLDVLRHKTRNARTLVMSFLSALARVTPGQPTSEWKYRTLQPFRVPAPGNCHLVGRDDTDDCSIGSIGVQNAFKAGNAGSNNGKIERDLGPNCWQDRVAGCIRRRR